MAARPKKPSLIAKQNFSEKQQPATNKDVQLRVFKGHKGVINRVAISGDGCFAITSGNDGTVRSWIIDGESEESTVLLKGDAFFGLAMAADCRLGAATDRTGQIHIFEINNPGNTLLVKVDGKFEGFGKELVGIDFIDDKRGSRQKNSRKFALTTVAFFGNQELVTATGDGKLRRWDAATGKCLAEWAFTSKGSQCGVAVSTDGKRIVGVAHERGLAAWSGNEEETANLFKEPVDPNVPIYLSDDGRFAFTGTLQNLVVKWSISEGRRISAFEGHSGPVRAVAVTPDGRFCVSGDTSGVIRLWAAETGQCLAVLQHNDSHSKAIESNEHDLRKIHRNWINCLALTPDARRLFSAANDGTLNIWEIPDIILDRAGASQRRGYMNAKVVLLGDSGVGKTGLALRLWHNCWRKTESTHGMEIQRLTLPHTGGEQGVEREVWLWDLAGQADYRLTHQLFMEQTSLALLVFDPQESDIFGTVGYWQNALRKVTHSENTAGVLVAARCDRPGLRLTIEEVRDWAADRGLQGPILTAAKLKRHSGAAELRELITNLLPWDTMEFRSTMENFPPLKDAILAVRDDKGIGGIVVKPKDLESRVRKIAPELSFTAEDLRAVTGLLAGEGVLHALPYGDLVVLQPSWVNCYASTLVKMAGEAENQLGHVPLATIQAGQLPQDGTLRLNTEDERQLLPALVALFLERALAWKQTTDKGEMLIFPNYVRLPRPVPPPRPGRTVLYRFTGPLEEIYCTLVVRLHYSGIFAKSKLYRQAVDFVTATGKLAALTLREQGERGELEIYFGAELDADVQASFQRFVHDHLKAKSVNLERLRNFFCPKCKEEVTDRKVIDAAIEKMRNKIICAYCDPEDTPGMIDLNDVLEQQFASEAGEEGADEADRKARDEITTASMEGVMVGEVQTIVFSADQIYRTVAEPDEGVDGEIEFRTSKKKASGRTYRVQLKSGDSHLRVRKDGTEIFVMKQHYEEHWAGETTVPVLLIIRSSDCRIRYMNATDAIRLAKKSKPGKPVKQIAFNGIDFTKETLLRLRDERLKD